MSDTTPQSPVDPTRFVGDHDLLHIGLRVVPIMEFEGTPQIISYDFRGRLDPKIFCAALRYYHGIDAKPADVRHEWTRCIPIRDPGGDDSWTWTMMAAAPNSRGAFIVTTVDAYSVGVGSAD